MAKDGRKGAIGTKEEISEKAWNVFDVAPSRKIFDPYELWNVVTDPEELVCLFASIELNFLPSSHAA